MDFVDEKHVAFFEAREKPGEFACPFNYGAAGVLDVHIHRVGDDVSQGCLPETRRAT